MHACVCEVHLGADDSLGGSFNVGRQTKECRPVILWEILYDTPVVLEGRKRVTHIQIKLVRKKKNKSNNFMS